MVVAAAAAAAVVLGVVGVGVGIATAAAVAVVAAAAVAVVVEAEVAAAAEVVIESGFHIGICCGVIGFGYGSGMDRLSRYGCEGRERGISSLV